MFKTTYKEPLNPIHILLSSSINTMFSTVPSSTTTFIKSPLLFQLFHSDVWFMFFPFPFISRGLSYRNKMFLTYKVLSFGNRSTPIVPVFLRSETVYTIVCRKSVRSGQTVTIGRCICVSPV